MTSSEIKDFFAKYPGPFAYAAGTDGTENCFNVVCTKTDAVAFATYYWHDEIEAEMRASTLATALNQLRTVSDDEIRICWSIEDVQQERPDLNREQAQSVLHSCKRGHDATVGVNWEVISDVASNLFPINDATLGGLPC